MQSMTLQARFHDLVLQQRLSAGRWVCITGPRQVGRTAACKPLSPAYLDCNTARDRLVLLGGAAAIIQHLALDRVRERDLIVVIDNLHGHREWRPLLRTLNTRCAPGVRFVITTLDAAFADAVRPRVALRIHPWSVGECARAGSPDVLARPSTATPDLIKPAVRMSDEDWTALLEHGGFPEPFEERDPRFTRRWNAYRWEELIERDLPRLAAVRETSRVQMLATLLASRSATPLIYSDLSRELGVTVDTVRRWMDLVERLQLGFRVRPWFARVPKALRKEPKWFLRDWACVMDPSARTQTLVACHLLKSAQGWTDLGCGQFEVRYVRDKAKREVDFLMLRDRRPWFLVTISPDDTVDPALQHFQACTRTPHAFQLSMHAPDLGEDCFQHREARVVPARTLLSQLL